MADEKPDKDYVLMGPHVDEKGNRAFMRNTKDGVNIGIIGRPENMEGGEGLIKLEQVAGPVFEVAEEINYTSCRSRPATDSYRKGWTAIFGKTAVGEA